MAFGNGHDALATPVAAVVSPSSLMLRRLADPLKRAGFEVVDMNGFDSFLKHPRQRPFVVCFMDARGKRGGQRVSACRRARPGERYVFIRDVWEHGGKVEVEAQFGRLCEAFSEAELLGWALKAAEDERQSKVAPPLEELLYGLFSDFLRDLGPASIKDLHKLVTERVERPLLSSVLEWSRGNQSKAAEALGLHRNTLRAKMRALGVSGRHGRGDDE